MAAANKSQAKRRSVTVTFWDYDRYLAHADPVGSVWLGERNVLLRCPAHPDGRPSWHLWEDEAGCGCHCFAGCTREEIEAALSGGPTYHHPRVIHSFGTERPSRGEIVAVYIYRDAFGELAFRKVRFEPKTFELQRPVVVPARTEGPVKHDEYTTWAPGLKDRWGEFIVQPVPYCLPELLAADEVWIADGEKDCDALAESGAVATCSPYGMAHWQDKWSELLEDKSVIVVADRDEPGYRAANKVFESVSRYSDDVVVVESPIGKDAHDLLSGNGSLDDFQPVEAV